ncbi:hypothetical protein DFH09DRAFT_1338943 [Mycena vulgaris]|nr:hypothetical protein DFH09DRAFT_1338943 [Mycena vulgaris]
MHKAVRSVRGVVRAHGLLSAAAISMYGLRAQSKAQTYGLAIAWNTYGAEWEEQMMDGLVSIGLGPGAQESMVGAVSRIPELPVASVKLQLPGDALIGLATEATFTALHPAAAISFTASPAMFKHPASAASSSSETAGAFASSESVESSEAEIVDFRRYSAAFPCSPAHACAPGARASPRASGSRGACSSPGWARC